MTWLIPRRGAATKYERILRSALAEKHIKFKPQVLIKTSKGKFRVDILLLDKPIIIEVKGSVHDLPHKRYKDKIRQQALEQAGYTVLNYSNLEINQNLKTVIKEIKIELKRQ